MPSRGGLAQLACQQRLSQQARTCSVVCQAAGKSKSKGLYERYKANRAKHEGVLLPFDWPQHAIPSPISIEPLEQFLHQAIASYTFGQEAEPGPNTAIRDLAALQQAPQAADQLPATSRTRAQGPSTTIPAPVAPLDTALDNTALTLPPPHNPAKAKVYVYWDVASKHPGSSDPRVVAARIASLAARFGTVQGLYAYAVRKDWNWVPQYFMQYRPRGGDVSEGEAGSLRCSICGVSRRSQVELDAHVKSVHPGRVAVPATNSATGATGQVAVTRNTSRRTLGRVSAYHTAAGQVVVPPAGHQLSLKYCLSQEGWEARIVQNAAEAESVAIASGMSRLLDRLRRGSVELQPGERPVIVCVSDDLTRLQQPLVRLRGIGGAATIAVHSGGGQGGAGQPGVRGADLQLNWEHVIMHGM